MIIRNDSLKEFQIPPLRLQSNYDTIHTVPPTQVRTKRNGNEKMKTYTLAELVNVNIDSWVNDEMVEAKKMVARAIRKVGEIFRAEKTARTDAYWLILK